MCNRDILKFMVEKCKAASRALLKDISEEDSLIRINGYSNHIRWESGHLARGLSQILGCLDCNEDFPERWTELFSIGSIPSEDTSVYPSLKEIKEKMENLYDKIISTIETIDEDNFEEKIQIFTEWNDSRINGVLFLCLHDWHHGGHIMVLRKAIGKERGFG